MKKILLLAVASLVAFDRVGAHEHVEVGVDPHDSLRLGLSENRAFQSTTRKDTEY